MTQKFLINVGKKERIKIELKNCRAQIDILRADGTRPVLDKQIDLDSGLKMPEGRSIESSEPRCDLISLMTRVIKQ